MRTVHLFWNILCPAFLMLQVRAAVKIIMSWLHGHVTGKTPLIRVTSNTWHIECSTYLISSLSLAFTIFLSSFCTGQIGASTSPPAYPRHLSVHHAWVGGNLNVNCLGRVGNLNQINLLIWQIMPARFFSFCRVWRIYKTEFHLS